jgi:hypothetical protein
MRKILARLTWCPALRSPSSPEAAGREPQDPPRSHRKVGWPAPRGPGQPDPAPVCRPGHRPAAGQQHRSDHGRQAEDRPRPHPRRAGRHRPRCRRDHHHRRQAGNPGSRSATATQTGFLRNGSSRRRRAGNYALRVACCLPMHALPAPIARIITLTAPRMLGLFPGRSTNRSTAAAPRIIRRP